jgi:hypothetical protein
VALIDCSQNFGTKIFSTPEKNGSLFPDISGARYGAGGGLMLEFRASVVAVNFLQESMIKSQIFV